MPFWTSDARVWWERFGRVVVGSGAALLGGGLGWLIADLYLQPSSYRWLGLLGRLIFGEFLTLALLVCLSVVMACLLGLHGRWGAWMIRRANGRLLILIAAMFALFISVLLEWRAS